MNNKDYMKEFPIVKVFKSQSGKQYILWCPFCKEFHGHGSAGLGHRGAHCPRDGNSPYLKTGYILEEYTKKELAQFQLPIK